MKKGFKGSAKRAVAAVILCAFLLSTSGIGVYAEGEADSVEDTQSQGTSSQNTQTQNISEVTDTSDSSKNTATQDVTQDDNNELNSDITPSQNDGSVDSGDPADDGQTDNQTDNDTVVDDDSLLEQDSTNLLAGELETSLLAVQGGFNLSQEMIFSEWKYNGNKTHIRTYTFERDGSTESEIEDCEIYEELIEENDTTYVVVKCKKCNEVFEKWQATPVITNQTSGVVEENYEQKTFTALVTCDDIIHGLNKDEVDVKMEAKRICDGKVEDLELEPTEKIYDDGAIKCQWVVPENGDEKGVFYAINDIKATNTYRKVSATCQLDCIIIMADPVVENSYVNFKISGKDYSYDLNEGYDSEKHWYSNKGDNDDILTVNIHSEVQSKGGVTIDSFIDMTNENAGVNLQPSIEPIHKTVEGDRLINRILWWLPRTPTTYIDDYVYNLPTNNEGTNTYIISYTVANVPFTKVVHTYIDNTAPEITDITYNNEKEPVGSADAEKGYYKEAVKVAINVTEMNLTNTQELEGISLHNDTTGQDISFTVSEADEDNGKYTFVATAEADGKYSISGSSIADLAGNISSELSTDEFTIDTKDPEATIKFDNEDVRNGKYYNAARTATITVTDANFEPDDSAYAPEISAEVGTAKLGSWESIGDDSYTRKVTFDEDGIYSIKFACRDKASNHSKEISESEFVIDTTKPQISVSYDNNSVKNKIYFNSARKATIKFEDLSFSESLVTVTKTGDNALPSIGSYSDSDNKHETTMTFENDGRYAFKIECEDLAGNVADQYSSDEFVIDTQAPEIEIAGVENMSANNDVVEPIINATDLNLADNDVTITVIGSNNGEIALSKKSDAITDGYTVKIGDIPHEKANDDLYTLVAKVTDQAGNETEKKIQYSINRFGSVYVLSDATKKMIEDYYVTSPEDVVITEINVDTLTYKDVSVTHDGSVKNIKEGKGYTTSDVTNDRGWHSISYAISKNNFSKDGIYSVAVYSEDKATNKQSNQSKDAEIEFLLDATAPSVVVSGIESDGVYEESEHDFSVNATDTIGLTGLSIYLDNEELAYFTGSELLKNGGTEIVTIPGKDDYQQVYVICTDVAGNETRLSYNNILISEKAQELIFNGEIQKKEIPSEPVIKHGGNNALPITAAVAGMLTLSAGGAFGLKKFRIKK